MDVVIDRVEVPALGADPACGGQPHHDRTMGAARLLTAREEQLLKFEGWFVSAHVIIVRTMMRICLTPTGRGAGPRRWFGEHQDSVPET